MAININHQINDISATSGNVTIGSAPVVAVEPGTSGNVLTSNGTSWTSAAPSGGGSSTLTIQNKTSAYTVVAGDLGTIINCTSGTFTVTLTAAATLGSGFNCWIWNTGTGAITIDPSSSETIDGKSTVVLYSGQGTQIVCDGTNWQSGDSKRSRLYAENSNIGGNNFPTASGERAVAIGSGAQASGTSSVALGASYAGGSTSFSAANGNGTAAYGALGDSSIAIGENSKVTTTGGIAIGGLTLVTSSYSTAFGRLSSGSGAQAVTGSGAMALGGSYASGTDSLAAAVSNNTSSYGSTGANSVAFGFQAKASNTNAVAIGGQVGIASAIASGAQSVALVHGTASGSNSFAWGTSIAGVPTASGAYSVAFGADCSATQTGSYAYGRYAVSAIIGKWAYAHAYFSSIGDAQTGTFVLCRATTNDTPTVLTTNNTSPGSDDQIILPNNSAYAFSGIVVARRQAAGGTASAAWEVKGLIRREATAASTVLVNSAFTVIDNTPGWALALSADTTNGGLAITVTGAASTNIRWVATVQTSEVTYA